MHAKAGDDYGDEAEVGEEVGKQKDESSGEEDDSGKQKFLRSVSDAGYEAGK